MPNEHTAHHSTTPTRWSRSAPARRRAARRRPGRARRARSARARPPSPAGSAPASARAGRSRARRSCSRRTHPTLVGIAPLVHVDAYRLGERDRARRPRPRLRPHRHRRRVGRRQLDGVAESWIDVRIDRPTGARRGGDAEAERRRGTDARRRRAAARDAARRRAPVGGHAVARRVGWMPCCSPSTPRPARASPSSIATPRHPRGAESVTPTPCSHAEVIGALIETRSPRPASPAASSSASWRGMGPGPFTGLRVGIAAARAFALGIGASRRADRLATTRSPWPGTATAARRPLSRHRRAPARGRLVAATTGSTPIGLPVRADGPDLASRATTVAAGSRASGVDATRVERRRARNARRAPRTRPAAPVRRRPTPSTCGLPMSRSRPRSGSPRERWELRRASVADLDALMALEDADLPERRLVAHDSDARRARRPHRYYLVASTPVHARADDRSACSATPGSSRPQGAGEADIQTIAVARGVRGVGPRPGAHARAHRRGASSRRRARCFLEVRADNPIAQRALPRRSGSSEIGVRPRYYQPDDVDAIMMRLDLPAAVTRGTAGSTRRRRTPEAAMNRMRRWSSASRRAATRPGSASCAARRCSPTRSPRRWTSTRATAASCPRSRHAPTSRRSPRRSARRSPRRESRSTTSTRSRSPAAPGLAGALMVGVGAAKALAIALGKPLYAVNHLVGHVGADLLDA